MLSSKQLRDINGLQEICEKYEHIKLKLNWDLLETRNELEQNDFFHYEGDKLVGFIGLYGFGTKIELCGMVHPHYRRKGIFSRLLKDALKEVKSRNVREVYINAPEKSESGKAFLKQFPCRFSFREYQMKWNEKHVSLEEGVHLRKATKTDFNLEIQLDVECFGFLESEARSYNEQIKREVNQDFFIIEQGSNAVGKVRIHRQKGESWIYGFSVLPRYQKQGIGRKALKQLVFHEIQKGNEVHLEVQATNEHALKLYTWCGFQVYDAQDYYVV